MDWIIPAIVGLNLAVIIFGAIIVREGMKKMSAELDTLTQEVSENTTVVQSAITLIGSLATKIEELKNDPVALQALADQLNVNEQALAAAVAANTPTPPPVEPPTE